MKLKYERGFTLIELLVVIAIIGILSAVVLASLNSARGRGADASVKENLTSVRTQAELVYTTNNSYASVCADTRVKKAIVESANAEGYSSGWWISQGDNSEDIACNDETDVWLVYIRMKLGSNKWWCVDNTGLPKSLTVSPGQTATACP